MSQEVLELIGDDGTLEMTEFLPPVIGDGTKSLDELAQGALGSKAGKGYWFVIDRAASGSLLEGFEKEELFPASGDEVPAAGDKLSLTVNTVIADHVSWSGTVTGAKVDITRGIHRFKQSRFGKYEFAGKMSGLFTIGVTDQAGGMLNRYFKIISKNADGTITISPIRNAPFYIRGVVRNTKLAGEWFEFMWAKINTGGFGLGAESGSPQKFDTDFSLAGIDPVFYKEELTA